MCGRKQERGGSHKNSLDISEKKLIYGGKERFRSSEEENQQSPDKPQWKLSIRTEKEISKKADETTGRRKDCASWLGAENDRKGKSGP